MLSRESAGIIKGGTSVVLSECQCQMPHVSVGVCVCERGFLCVVLGVGGGHTGREITEGLRDRWCFSTWIEHPNSPPPTLNHTPRDSDYANGLS